MVARVTISLPEELLAKLDAEAASAGSSRSWVAQEAMANYLGKSLEQRLEDERRASIAEAIEGMLHFEDGRVIRDDRPSLEILREIRETNDSAPMRDIRKKVAE
ncbi:MAG TPA: ribbon-helix-helix domain-containing protein [Coriobacteriia bacterium]